MNRTVFSINVWALTAIFLLSGYVNAEEIIGRSDYATYCATCHRLDGAGSPPTIPALAGSPLVMNAEPDILVKLILDGGFADLAMPRFLGILTDRQSTDITHFIKNAWNNQSTSTEAHFNHE